MEKDGFPTEIESGNNYGNMVTTNIQIFIVMRNTHSKFIDKILKEIWSEIDIKMNDGIYTEEFLMSLYKNLSEYVDDEFATEFLKEIETTSGKKKNQVRKKT